MKKVFLSIISLLVLSSCNSLLDKEPITEQTENQFYRTEADAFQALVAAYDPLQWDSFELYCEVLSDNCYGGGGSANDIPFTVKMARWQMDIADPNVDILWNKFYSGIYRVNILLEKIDGISFADSEKKQRMISECYFLRAYYYWGLVRCFGNVPLILKTLEPSEYYTQNQVSPDVVFTQIRKDLTMAIDGKLPARTAIQASEAGRISKEAAQSLLVRIWMFYTGAYNKSDMDGMSKTDAITMIKSVISTCGASLLPDYADIFDVAKKNGAESIFETQYTYKSSWGDWGYLQGGDGNFSIIRWGIREPDAASPYSAGWSFAPVRASLYTEFSASDKRRDATVVNMNEKGWSYTPGYQNTGIFNNKYTTLKVNEPTSGGSRELNFPNNQIIIRYSDVLLMASELLLDSDLGLAQQYFNQVVKRAMGDSYVVPSVTMELIREERKLEFALEGIRLWDLRRYGLDYMKSAIEAENSKVGAEFQKTFDLKHQGLMPIPYSQTILCKQLVQNPGY